MTKERVGEIRERRATDAGMKKDGKPRKLVTDGGSGVEAAGAGLPRNNRAAPHQMRPMAPGAGRPNGN